MIDEILNKKCERILPKLVSIDIKNFGEKTPDFHLLGN